MKTQLGGVQHILQEFHFPLVKPPLVENRRHHHQHVVRVDAPTELHELQHVHAHGAAEHATVGDQERQRQEVALLHHAVPAAIEEAADEEDGAVAGLGGCVCEERVEEFEQDDAAVHVEGERGVVRELEVANRLLRRRRHLRDRVDGGGGRKRGQDGGFRNEGEQRVLRVV